MDTIPYWRNIWQTVSGGTYNALPTAVKELLSTAKDDLLAGLCSYSAYTDDSYKAWTALSRVKTGSQLDALMHRIALAVNSDVRVVWRMFCNYLMFEYHGNIHDIELLVHYELNIRRLIGNFSYFYSMERMFCLRTLQAILQHAANEAHPHQEFFAQLVNEWTFEKIRGSILKQLKMLHDEVNSEPYKKTEDKREWILQNTNEQIVLLMIYIHLSQTKVLEGSNRNHAVRLEQFLDLTETSRKYNYGVSYTARDLLDAGHVETLRNVTIGAILNEFRLLWDNADLWMGKESTLDSRFLGGGFQLADFGIVAISWIVLQLSPDNPNRKQVLERYDYFIDKVISPTGDLLNILANIANNGSSFSDTESTAMALAIYQLVDSICKYLSVEDSLYSYKGAVPLLVALLKHESVAHIIFTRARQSRGLGLLVLQIERRFPYDYVSFTRVLDCIANHASLFTYICQKVRNMQHYTEMFQSQPTAEPFTVQMAQLYRPKIGCDIVAPVGNLAQVCTADGASIVTYETMGYNYLKVLAFTFQIQAGRVKGIALGQLTRSTPADCFLYSLRLIGKFLTNKKFAGVEASIEYLWPTCIQALTPGSEYPATALSECFDIFADRLFDSYSLVVNFLRVHDMVPTFAAMSSMPTALLHSRTQMRLMDLDLEMPQKGHRYVHLMLELLRVSIVQDQEFHKIQLPLTRFMLEDVFAQHRNWQYHATSTGDSASNSMNRLTLKVLQVLYVILQRSTLAGDEKACKERVELYTVTMSIVMHHEGFIQAFRSIFNRTTCKLELMMCGEMDWTHGRTLVSMQVVHQAISLLLQIMQKVHSSQPLVQLPLLSELARIEDFSHNVLKTIAGLVNQCFVPAMAEAACRLLAKYAEYKSVILLAHLGLDSYQVRGLFLEKLRDPVQTVALKIAIVDLITTCLEHQNGMTAAFFNLMDIRKPDGTTEKPEVMASRKQLDKEIADDVFSFVEEFLTNLQKTNIYLLSPLQSSILNLVCKLWQTNDGKLAHRLRAIDNFWPMLINPIIAEGRSSSNVDMDRLNCARVLDIVAFELFRLHTTKQQPEREPSKIKKTVILFKASGVTDTKAAKNVPPSPSTSAPATTATAVGASTVAAPVPVLSASREKQRQIYEDFIKTVESLFTDARVVKHVFALVRSSDRKSRQLQSYRTLSSSVRRFFMIATRTLPELFATDCELRNSLLLRFVQTLHNEVSQPVDNALIELWADVTVYLVVLWQLHEFSITRAEFAADVVALFSKLHKCYDACTAAVKDAIVTMAICMLRTCAKHLWHGDGRQFRVLVDTMQHMFRREQEAAAELRLPADDTRPPRTWVLHITFAIRLLSEPAVAAVATSEFHMDVCRRYFRDTDMIGWVLHVAGVFFNRPAMLQLAKLATQLLHRFAASDLYEDITASKLDHFLYRVRPQSDVLCVPTLQDITKKDLYHSSTVWVYEDFWTCYTGLLRFMTRLLRRDRMRYFAPACTLLHFHEDILKAALALPASTVELSALLLAQTTVQFVGEVVNECRSHWQYEDRALMLRLVQAVYQCWNCCTQLLFIPNTMRFITCYLQMLPAEQIPADVMVAVTHRVMMIVHSILEVFAHHTPTLLQICHPEVVKQPMEIRIDTVFSVPTITNQFPDYLTYGNLICLVHLMCKIQAYISDRHTTAPISSPSPPSPKPRTGASAAPVAASDLLGFVCTNMAVGKHLGNTMKRISGAEFFGEHSPWFSMLDANTLQATLERALLLLASEIFLRTYAIRDLRIRHQLFSGSSSGFGSGGDHYKGVDLFLRDEVQHIQDHVKRHYRFRTTSDQRRDSSNFTVASAPFNNRRSDAAGQEDNEPQRAPDGYFRAHYSSRVLKRLHSAPTDDEFLIFICHWFDNVCHLGR